MHGDFSRGHRPDAKRNKSYTRGFAQQRRLLLDSDLNAMTDAIHERLRALARHTGCPKGSPDLGYLVTPGRLLALFDDLDGVVTTSSKITVFRDYSRKYLDRYPSLALAADQGVAGSVTVRLRSPVDGSGQTVLWCRADSSTTVTIAAAVFVTVPDIESFEASPITLTEGLQDLQIQLSAGSAIWIGLIEQLSDVPLTPLFNYAAGYYYLDGLPLFNPTDAPSETDTVPGPLNLQTYRLLVYLEGTERHVTSIEDPGIRENALGGDTDTTTRGHAVGKVKLAEVPPSWVPDGPIQPDFDFEKFSRELDDPVLADGTLNVTTPLADPNPDPCALPAQGGYTGSDNRFYRFEVHRGGALGAAVLKWSRDNGAELFPVVSATDQILTFPANTLLQPGDLVEVLTADSIESGDALRAVLTASGRFTPPVRAVGRLARLQAGTSAGVGVTFALREPDGVSPVTLDPHFEPFSSTTLKVRRWHGLIQTAVSPAPNVVEIENGIEIELNGSFSPGDYWQYEARTGSDNANGPFQTKPHGPERDFAPLALMKFAGTSLLLERWLDHRFPPLCELEADDIAFDGDRIDTESDTVQEVIEELWERNVGCCDLTISDTDGDVAEAIREILQETAGEITICFKPGVYTFLTQLEITDRKVVLKGCPRAVFVAGPLVKWLIGVRGSGSVLVEELILFSLVANECLIDMTGPHSSLEARAVGMFAFSTVNPNLPPFAIRVDLEQPAPIDELAPVPVSIVPFPQEAPSIRLDRCVVAAGWVISAAWLIGLEVTDSFFSCKQGCIWSRFLASVDIRNTEMVAGVSTNMIGSWTPALLLTKADELVEQLTRVHDPSIASTNGICIRTQRLFIAEMSGCRLKAGICVGASRTQSVGFHGNEYYAANMGIYIVHSAQTTVDGELMTGLGLNAKFGAQLLLSGGFSITDCFIIGFQVGMALGAESAGLNSRFFTSVQIQNNQIEGRDIGIQVGTANGAFNSGAINHVAITENNIRTRALGVLLNANVGFAGQEVQFKHVRVADNTISARMGIGVMGSLVELSDNCIRLFSETSSGSRFGIVALDSFDLVCESNRVELAFGPGLDSEFVGSLPAASLLRIGVFASYLGASTVSWVAITIESTAKEPDQDHSIARVNVAQNRTEGWTLMMSLAASDQRQLAVKGNDFLSGPVECERLLDLVFLSNTVLGRVGIKDCDNGGMICDNRVRLHSELPGDLSITNVGGDWKVADNRADGTIVIRPRPGSVGIGIDLGNVGRGFRGSVLAGLHVIAGQANDERFNSIVFAQRGDALAEQAAVADRPALGDIAMSITNPEWRAVFVNSINEFVRVGARDVIGVIDGFDIGPVITLTEGIYQLQCTSNWARHILVGNTSALGNPLTTVQVISNRADLNLSVLQYSRLIMALNVAHTFQPALGTPPPILAPNLLI